MTRKPKPRKPAPKVAAKPIEPGVEALRGIKELVAKHNFIEAERKYQKAMTGAVTGWAGDDDAQLATIERKLAEIVPESFEDVFALLEFATQKIADRLVTRDGQLGPVIMLRNLRKGIQAAKINRDVQLIHRRVEDNFKERRELLSIALKG